MNIKFTWVNNSGALFRLNLVDQAVIVSFEAGHPKSMHFQLRLMRQARLLSEMTGDAAAGSAAGRKESGFAVPQKYCRALPKRSNCDIRSTCSGVRMNYA
jgi:hypothetical protein